MTAPREADPVNLTTAELAVRLRTSPNAIRIMRCRGNAPEAIKRGNRLLWPVARVEAWERSLLVSRQPA